MKIQLIPILLSLLFSTQLLAAPLAELQTSIAKGTDAKIAKDLRSNIQATVNASPNWTLHKANLGKGKHCFTIDCLIQAGQSSGDNAGIRIRFSGEAQIYDWSIEIYDLKKGRLLGSQKGACELCGKSEVLRTFNRSLTQVLGKAKPRRAQNTTPDKKEKKEKKVTKRTEKEKPLAKEKQLPDLAEKLGNEKSNTVDSSKKDSPTQTLLSVEVVPASSRILLNGKEIGRGSIELRLLSGHYTLEFKKEGYAGLKENLNIEGGQKALQMKIHLSKSDPDPVVMKMDRGLIGNLEQRPLWGWIGIGSGGVLLVSGIILSRIDGTQTCATGSFQQCPEIYNTGTEAMITTTAGVALLTAGTGLLLWDFLAGKDADRQSVIVPSGNGVSFIHKF